ncbi:CaiB/BaiF CoA transferase family protein [Terricaulis sp.]|uniref:CaiB/BaiF CoA transferase family protein n=1 Tax=Terricaulis sp. TaxID=2768686 RepID=UPI003783F31B
MASGPLKGVKVVEFAGIGPGPFCCMLLSDMGADVVRIDRKGGRSMKNDILARGRRSIALDMKEANDVEIALKLVEKADILIEGFRPGVMERLGVGPDVALNRNPKLVYGRMTGWGQTGPLAHAAGHDLNYIALTGALFAMGRKDVAPSPPLNLVGDFGGGALYLAMGVCAALFEAQRSGQGQVIDAAITDGVTSTMAMMLGFRASGIWTDDRDANLLDGGAPFYDVYATKDGRYVSIGSIEPQFYALLLEKTGLKDDPAFAVQLLKPNWADMSEKLAAVIASRTRDEWTALMEGTDVCFAPVLSMAEAPTHPHNAARETFVAVDGLVQPNVAPRFSRTPGQIQGPAPEVGAQSEEILADWGVRIS